MKGKDAHDAYQSKVTSQSDCSLTSGELGPLIKVGPWEHTFMVPTYQVSIIFSFTNQEASLAKSQTRPDTKVPWTV